MGREHFEELVRHRDDNLRAPGALQALQQEEDVVDLGAPVLEVDGQISFGVEVGRNQRSAAGTGLLHTNMALYLKGRCSDSSTLILQA